MVVVMVYTILYSAKFGGGGGNFRGSASCKSRIQRLPYSCQFLAAAAEFELLVAMLGCSASHFQYGRDFAQGKTSSRAFLVSFIGAHQLRIQQVRDASPLTNAMDVERTCESGPQNLEVFTIDSHVAIDVHAIVQ